MKRSKSEEDLWQGKISYSGHEEEINDPADVEKKIREGNVPPEILIRSFSSSLLLLTGSSFSFSSSGSDGGCWRGHQ